MEYENLKDLQEHLLMTNEEICKELGVSEACWLGWKAGRRFPKMKNLDAIGKLCGKTRKEVYEICKRSKKERFVYGE